MLSRPGGFSWYWNALDRLLLVGAEPLDQISLSEIPFDRAVEVEVVAVEKHGGRTYTVRDGSGRVAVARWTEDKPVWVGDVGLFERRLEPGSPRVYRLKADRGFALVGPDGLLLARADDPTVLLSEQRETARFQPKRRGRPR